MVAAASSFWWVQPAITVLVGIFAGCYAWATISANRKMARMRATLDLIERTELQLYYQNLWRELRAAREGPGGLPALLHPVTETQKEQRPSVLDFLNHYELVAVGCKQGVLEEEFYKQFMRSAFLRDWVASRDLIRGLREPPAPAPKRPTLFEHFEALAVKWQAELDGNVGSK